MFSLKEFNHISLTIIRFIYKLLKTQLIDTIILYKEIKQMF